MDIIVTGCRNPFVEQELISGTRFYANELLSSKMKKHIIIEIDIKSAISDLGNCSISYYNDWYKPREFIIQLKARRSLKNTLVTLAHEIVHVKQFAKGELNPANDKWKGESVDVDTVDYSDLPWEVEASSLEFVLYALYQERKAGNI
jgi:hypothetical protein